MLLHAEQTATAQSITEIVAHMRADLRTHFMKREAAEQQGGPGSRAKQTNETRHETHAG